MTETIDTGTDQLLARIEDRVGVVTLNRPEARNALSDELTPALRTMVARFAEDDAVGALLITGAGAAFCAGGDVKGMASRGIEVRQVPVAGLIEQADRDRHALDGVHLDLIEPIPELVVGFEHSLFHRDVAGFLDSGHLDHRELGTVAVAVLDWLGFRVETGNFLK